MFACGTMITHIVMTYVAMTVHVDVVLGIMIAHGPMPTYANVEPCERNTHNATTTIQTRMCAPDMAVLVHIHLPKITFTNRHLVKDT